MKLSAIPPRCDDHVLDDLVRQGALEVTADGQVHAHAGVANLVLMPGSFNPIHEGHRKLAEATENLLGRSVAFELSLVNVDKPDLTWDDVHRRAEQFRSRASIWLTRAPTFVQKAVLFPQATFVVGADTAVRILADRYYASEDGVVKALRHFRNQECRFVVGGRTDASQSFIRLADLAIPPEFRDLFTEIPPEIFRLDLSSTDLRNRPS